MPTKAEWEYACRAGSEAIYCFGNNEKMLDTYAWHSESSAGQAHVVGTKQPNSWGLYDMHGNVKEWVQDCYDEHYYVKSPQADPINEQECLYRVCRGGCWNNSPEGLLSALREGVVAYTCHGDNGFCIVRTIP